MEKTPVDAIPDLSDVQVIVYTEYPGQGPGWWKTRSPIRSPPAMLSVPSPRWCGDTPSSAILSFTSSSKTAPISTGKVPCPGISQLCGGKTPLGRHPHPGARRHGCRLGLRICAEGYTGTKDLQQLRSIQDWFLRYELAIGSRCFGSGQHRRFRETVQVEVDPNKLLAFNLSIEKVKRAIQESNEDVAAGFLRWRRWNSWFGAWGIFSPLTICGKLPWRRRGGNAHFCSNRWPTCIWDRSFAAASWNGTAGARQWGHYRHALR